MKDLKSYIKISTVNIVVFFSLFILAEIFLKVAVISWGKTYKYFFSKDDSIYLYIIGGSTSYGEPYSPHIGYDKITAQYFNYFLDEKRIKIINLASPGINLSKAYWKFYWKLLFKPEKHGIVLVYSGINDYFSKQTDQNIVLWKIINKSKILSLLINKIEQYNLFSTSHFFSNSLKKYEHHLKMLIAMSERNKYPIIISTLVGNIAEFPPGVSENYEPDKNKILSLLEQYEKNKFYNDAIDLFNENNNKIFFSDAYMLYKIGKIYYRLNIKEKAQFYLQKSTEIFTGGKPAPWLNNSIRNIVNINGAHLVDTDKTFKMFAHNNTPGYDLFIDMHHPNIKGYFLLAWGFVNKICELYKISPPDFETFYTKLNNKFQLDHNQICESYYHILHWFTGMSFATRQKSDIIERTKFYLKEAEQNNCNESLIVAYRLIVDILEKNHIKITESIKVLNNIIHDSNEHFSNYMRLWNHEYSFQLFDQLQEWSDNNILDKKILDDIKKTLIGE